jgi:hypothetical protein
MDMPGHLPSVKEPKEIHWTGKPMGPTVVMSESDEAKYLTSIGNQNQLFFYNATKNYYLKLFTCNGLSNFGAEELC